MVSCHVVLIKIATEKNKTIILKYYGTILFLWRQSMKSHLVSMTETSQQLLDYFFENSSTVLLWMNHRCTSGLNLLNRAALVNTKVQFRSIGHEIAFNLPVSWSII